MPEKSYTRFRHGCDGCSQKGGSDVEISQFWKSYYKGEIFSAYKLGKSYFEYGKGCFDRGHRLEVALCSWCQRKTRKSRTLAKCYPGSHFQKGRFPFISLNWNIRNINDNILSSFRNGKVWIIKCTLSIPKALKRNWPKILAMLSIFYRIPWPLSHSLLLPTASNSTPFGFQNHL